MKAVILLLRKVEGNVSTGALPFIYNKGENI